MPVFSIWESRFPPEHVERGGEVTDAIWQEMPDSSGPATASVANTRRRRCNRSRVDTRLAW